jgi:hypothetical protein
MITSIAPAIAHRALLMEEMAATSSAPDRRPSSAEPLPTPVSRCRDPGAWRVAKTHQVLGSLDAIREDRIAEGGVGE